MKKKPFTEKYRQNEKTMLLFSKDQTILKVLNKEDPNNGRE